MNTFVARALLVVGLLGGCAVAAQANTIILLTQDSWEGGSGQVGLPDDAFIAWLQGMGYAVDKKAVGGALSGSILQGYITADSASLVIIGPRNSSGNYTDKTGYNAITTPMLALMPHAVRSDRLGWLGATQGADNSPWTDYQWLVPTDARVAGLGTTLYNYPTGSGDTRWTTTPAQAGIGGVGGGTIIGTLNTGTTTVAAFVDWEPGQMLGGDNTTPAGGRRVWLGVTDWARNTPTGYQCNFDNLTADGKEVLRRTIVDLAGPAVPEPTSIAILGSGLAAIGWTWLRRRRK